MKVIVFMNFRFHANVIIAVHDRVRDMYIIFITRFLKSFLHIVFHCLLLMPHCGHKHSAQMFICIRLNSDPRKSEDATRKVIIIKQS